MDTKTLNRRSFAAAVLGGGVLGGALAVVAGRASAQTAEQIAGHYTAMTDADSGRGADPAGAGRGRRQTVVTGWTDRDAGSNADAGNYGRGPSFTGMTATRANGFTTTDVDRGAGADRAGQGSGPPNYRPRAGSSGLTDQDACHQYTYDRRGEGRGARTFTNINDGDNQHRNAPCRDVSGYGRPERANALGDSGQWIQPNPPPSTTPPAAAPQP